MNVEGNEAGYKAKEVRKSIEGTVGKAMLAAVSEENKAMLTAGSEGIKNMLFGSKKTENTLKLEEASSNATAELNMATENSSQLKDAVPIDIDIDMNTATDNISELKEATPIDIDIDINIDIDMNTVTENTSKLKDAVPIDIDINIDMNTATENTSERKEAVPTDIDLNTIIVKAEDLLEEQARVSASLRLCLEKPDQTWLMIDDTLGDYELDSEIERDEAALRKAITTMLFTRDELELKDEADILTYDQNQIIVDLEELQQSVDSIVSLAAAGAGYRASRKLLQELVSRRRWR